jgi:2-polyprenyl-6-hydroxyphenyl methylase/3-demethylubiquinone-9 3-methyltransferase
MAPGDTVYLCPISPPSAACKCCGQAAPLYGVADFHKSCNVGGPDPLPLSGIPVYYHRCRGCGFLFTVATDDWTPDDFARHIYNAEYLSVDPDYPERRPDANARMLAQLLGHAPGLRLLDYGGGSGLLAARLREQGFRHVDTFDPFVPQHAARPSGRYECVVSFEVLEHTPTPRETLTEMTSLLTPDGLLLFTTLLQGAEFDAQGMRWWYIGPRNGHVSLYSRAALTRLADALGFRFGSFNDNSHVLFRHVPEFARPFLKIS